MGHTQPVGLLRTSDQPVAQAATYMTLTKNQSMNIHALCEIRTRDPNSRSATDLRLRPHRYHVHESGT